MKQILGKSVLTLLVCCLAFGVAYATVRRASGEEGTTQGTPTVAASETPLPDSTIVPVETPSARRSFSSIEDLGELAPAGSVFEKWGVRMQMPSGMGDFRVIYPIIVDGPGAEDWSSSVIMTVYNIQTHSSLFLGFEQTGEGLRPVERGRHVEQAEASAALDEIISSVEVSAR